MSELNLSTPTVKKWKSRLPDDVKKIMDLNMKVSEEDVNSLVSKIKEISPWDIKEVLDPHIETFKNMGRGRRLRLLAWLAQKTSPDATMCFNELKGSPGESVSGDIIKEDMSIMAKALSARMAKVLTGKKDLNSIRQASMISLNMTPGGLK